MNLFGPCEKGQLAMILPWTLNETQLLGGFWRIFIGLDVPNMAEVIGLNEMLGVGTFSDRERPLLVFGVAGDGSSSSHQVPHFWRRDYLHNSRQHAPRERTCLDVHPQ